MALKSPVNGQTAIIAPEQGEEYQEEPIYQSEKDYAFEQVLTPELDVRLIQIEPQSPTYPIKSDLAPMEKRESDDCEVFGEKPFIRHLALNLKESFD